jgi:2-polyprenyl-6-hydroxyphenyl methylase/3-demethylubiquinone-9 3-methyltransferase
MATSTQDLTGERGRYDEYWRIRGERVGDRCGYEPNLRQFMARQLGASSRTERGLEVGCGDCQFTPYLQQHTERLTAIDISEYQIALNRQRYPEIEFASHDLANPLPFADNLFDFLWCSEVVEHLAQPRFAIEQFLRVLKPGGQLLLTVPHHGRLKNVLIALFKWDEHFDPEYPHLQYFTSKSLSRLVQRVGFEAIHTEICGMNRPLRDLVIPTNILLSARKPKR